MRQWNKETINEQLKLHKKQNKDERYNYFSREFNSLWYCWELEKYTISLQTQLQQKENIIKEVREYIENNDLYEQDYDYDYEENLVVGPPSDETARKILLEILDKVGNDNERDKDNK